MAANPNFPTQVWDGLTDRDGNFTNRERTSLNINLPPNGRDWSQLLAEMQQVQTYVLVSTGATIPSAVIDETILTGEAVKVKSNSHLIKADATTSPDVAGIALTAGTTGNTIQYITSGTVINLTWNLNPGIIYYLGTSGQISVSPVSLGWVIQMGQALAQQVFSVNIQQAIKL